MNLRTLLLMPLVLVTLTGCAFVPRERTLPASVQSVYVPMIVNRTSIPGVEERATIAIQEEILADGRLNLVEKKDADAIVYITLTRFDETARGFDSDDFPVGKSFDIVANMDIMENIPGSPKIGGTRRVVSTEYFNADTRTTTFDPEPRVMERAMEEFARNVVWDLISGEYDDVEPGLYDPIDTPPSRESGLSISR